MKIVHLAQYYLPHVGGVEKHLQMLNKELISRGHDVTVITQQHQENLKKEEVIDDVKIGRLHTHFEVQSLVAKNKYKLSIWSGLWKVKALLFDADIIHIHDVFFWIIPFLFFLPKKKLYITFHGYEGVDVPKQTQVFWHKVAAKMTAGNICVGHFHQKWYGVQPNIITYGAVELQKKEEKKSDKKKIVYIGRLAADTGIMPYLQALQLLSKNGKKFSLDVYGGGPQRQEAESFVEKHSLSVKFFGDVKNAAKVLSEYHTAFISRYLAILEAFSENVRVIAHFNNQIKKDYLGMAPFAAWIESAQSPEQIAAALEKIISESKAERDRIVSSAKDWVKQQTWKAMADNYEALWKKHG